TSNLLVQGAEPRKVIGTVNAVEFFLTLTISAAFISQLGVADLAGPTLGFLIGGVVAAPFGAYAAKHFSTKAMLILAGLVLTLTSAYGVYSALS
ncbi:MAG TPA: TSUP family transporter, partial [Sphingomonadaceae bacterium]|nr:TSUP family transporter [Sphingomonadaceae bacterium]